MWASISSARLEYRSHTAWGIPVMRQCRRFPDGPGSASIVKPSSTARAAEWSRPTIVARSEEHTSELQSLMRISYAVFCLKKKQKSKQEYNSVTNVLSYTKLKKT